MIRSTPLRAGTLLFAACSIGACRSAPLTQASAESLHGAEIAAREAIASESAINVAAIPANAVAVTPLRVSIADVDSSMGYALAALLMSDLSQSSQLRIVERLNMNALLRELDLAKAGKVDPATAPKVGKLIGASRVVTGAITSVPQGQLAISTNIVSTQTGEVRPAVSGSTTAQQLLRAQKELSFRLLSELGVTLTPTERARIEPLATLNMSALQAFGRGVQYETEGRYAAAAREFRRASQLDPNFSLATGRAVQLQSIGSDQVGRAIGVATDRLNPSLVQTQVGERSGAAEASTSQSATVRVRIVSPP